MKHARPPSAIHVDFDYLTASTEIILASDRFKALSVFTSIYGIGPNTARRLYSLGLRTIADLEVYYGVESSDAPPTELLEVELQRKHSRSWRGKGQVDEAELLLEECMRLQDHMWKLHGSPNGCLSPLDQVEFCAIWERVCSYDLPLAAGGGEDNIEDRDALAPTSHEGRPYMIAGRIEWSVRSR